MPATEFYDQVTPLSFRVTSGDEVGLGFLQNIRPTGEASVVQRIVKTTDGVVSGVLKGLQIKQKSEQAEFRKGNSFYTVLLDLVVRMPDPVQTFLEYATFRISLGASAEILRFAPEERGVKAVLKKSGERGFSISPSLQVGTLLPGVEAKASAEIEYTNKKGWAIEVPVNIDDVIGARVGPNVVEWQVAGNQSIEVPGGLIGPTSVVKASFIAKLPLNTSVEADITASGRVLKERAIWMIGLRGRVKLITPSKFTIHKEA